MSIAMLIKREKKCDKGNTKQRNTFIFSMIL